MLVWKAASFPARRVRRMKRKWPLTKQPRQETSRPGSKKRLASVHTASTPDSTSPPECENARDVLQAAGIPCYLELHEIEKRNSPEPTHDWRVLVPGKLNLRATSVLDQEIFNPEIEAQWRAHLEEAL